MDNPEFAAGSPPTPTSSQAEAPYSPPPRKADGALEVQVLFTTHSGTLAALKAASQLGTRLGVRPRVLIFYSMPLTLPLEDNLIPPGFLEGQIQALGRESATGFSAQVYICRDPYRSLRNLLPPHSLIVIGGKRRWWPTREQRLAAGLKRDGHQVIFVESG
jgi:hypothetical protein